MMISLFDRMNHWIIFLILGLVLSELGTARSLKSYRSFNVMKYGAVGDGKTDDSQAFLKGWKAACEAKSVNPILVIPRGKTFLLKPVNFNGPCKSSSVYVQVSGNIVAPNSKSGWLGSHIDKWLAFSYVNGLVINGKGRIDGRGSAWWSQPCMHNAPTGAKCNGPTALTFNRCNGLQLSGLTHVNSPRSHIRLTSCKGAILSNLRIIAPETSPNTDGIDVSSSTNVRIRNSIIGTGDDCIAISGGTSNVNISGIMCGPGHGISIGALGRGGYDTVEEIHVRNSTLKGTMTGVRIKSWQGGSGYARKISFEKIKFIAVNDPIIIDQFYCPSQVGCQNKTSAVKLSDISYSGIYGTSTTDRVINLSCSQATACTNVRLDRVYISTTTPKKKPFAYCFNAYGTATHTKPAVKCLKH